MGSLCTETKKRADGTVSETWRVLVGGGRRPRHTIRLGRVSKRIAETAKLHIDVLEEAAIYATAVPAATLAWLASLRDDIHARIVRAGLAEPREPEEARADNVTLGDLVDRYIASRVNLKPNTLRNYETTKRLLAEHFGRGRLVAKINAGHARDYREWLAGRYASATVAREIKRARQFLEYAKDYGFTASNPFAKVTAGSQRNSKRKHFVSQEVIAKVLEKLPDNNWRLALVLARYGGLRMPSELERLTWADIDWAGGRFTVRVPKKEHLDGHETRTIPLFPEIEPYLREAFDAAEEGSVYVLPPRFHADGYVRAGVLRAVERAGVPRWPKLLVNLRGSRETELLLEWPEHVVHAWLGHTKDVADAHYTMVTDSDFEKAAQPRQAAQKAAQSGTVWDHLEPSEPKKTPVFPAEARCTGVYAPPRGVEPRFSD